MVPSFSPLCGFASEFPDPYKASIYFALGRGHISDLLFIVHLK